MWQGEAAWRVFPTGRWPALPAQGKKRHSREKGKAEDVERVGRRDGEKRGRIGEGDEGKKGKEKKWVVAGRGGVESFSHRPVAGAPPRRGNKRRSRGEKEGRGWG